VTVRTAPVSPLALLVRDHHGCQAEGQFGCAEFFGRDHFEAYRAVVRYAVFTTSTTFPL
jgi:hypothetical protein